MAKSKTDGNENKIQYRPSRYLWRHVARTSRFPRHVVRGVVHLALGHDLAQAKIQQLEVTLRGEADVVRLDVAVDHHPSRNGLLVKVPQRRRQLSRAPQQLGGGGGGQGRNEGRGVNVTPPERSGHG